MNGGMKGRSILAGAAVMSIAPEAVLIPKRIGFYHEDKAVALGRLIAVDGQNDPIKVERLKKPVDGKEYRLVVGLHRLVGCDKEGIDVLALEVSGTREHLLAMEASENAHHRELGPIERAKFTAALAQATRERIAREHGNLSQQQLAIKARWDRVKHLEDTAEAALTSEVEDTMDNVSTVYSWKESVAAAVDLGKREVQRDLSLYRLLIEPFPDLIEPLSKHPVVGRNRSQLKKLTSLKDAAVRRRVIEALLADPEIGVDDAKSAAGVGGTNGPDATPVAHQKFYDQIIGGWDRLGNRERTRFLPKFAMLLTEGQKRDLRDLLNKELRDA